MRSPKKGLFTLGPSEGVHLDNKLSPSQNRGGKRGHGEGKGEEKDAIVKHKV